MATYTLIPSSLTGGDTITNASRAYTNTSSTTYATVHLNSSGRTAWLGGFDFGSVPDETIVSVTIKCKVNSQTSCTVRVYSSSDSDRVALSASEIVRNLSSDGLITFSLTSSKDVIISYLAAGTLCIPIYIPSSASYGVEPHIYGAEVIVETDATPKPNKIVYGENTIIDLTEDTVTRAKVLSGTTFHLPSGVRSVGTLPPPISPSMNTKTAYPSSYGITFRELANEPTWFLVACMSPGTTAYSTITFFMLYDGTTTYIMNGVGSSGSNTKRAVYSGSNAFTFSYTSGVLAISGNINKFNIPSTYETYTLYYI